MHHTNTSAMPMAGQVTNMPPMLGANMRPANFFITMADVVRSLSARRRPFFCVVYFIVDNILYISFLYESDGNNEGMWRECGRKKVRFKHQVTMTTGQRTMMKHQGKCRRVWQRPVAVRRAASGHVDVPEIQWWPQTGNGNRRITREFDSSGRI